MNGQQYLDSRLQDFESGLTTETLLDPPESGLLVQGQAVQDDDHPDLSHDALALAISAAGWTHNARYVNSWGRWMIWNGSRWEPDEKRQHFTGIRHFLKQTADNLIRHAEVKAQEAAEADRTQIMRWAHSNAKTLRSAATVSSVELLARSNADLVAAPADFDSNLDLLGTPDGAVDLKTGGLQPPERTHYITKHCAVTPAPPGTDPALWLSFLNRIFDNNQEIIDFMQRAAGYALTGHTREHKLFFLYGTGSNGKSVYLNTIYDLAGDYARRAPAATFLDSAGERHTTDLAGLRGARLVAGSELPAGKAWNEATIKDLTGGDVITARFMRQDFFEYNPQFTLFIAGNHQPSFRGIDEAIRRRVVLIPFTQTIPSEERDPMLSEKLKSEWPAILRWMIDGAVMWHKHGLQVPESVSAASSEYLDAEDAIGEFIADHLQKQHGSHVTTAAMYERFCAWQEDNGIRQPWTKKAMTQALKERGIEHGRGTGGVRGFKNVALVTTASMYQQAKGRFVS